MLALVFASIKEQRALSRRWRFSAARCGRWSCRWCCGWCFQRHRYYQHDAPLRPLLEIKGEIASGADASAEFVVAAMRSAFEDSGLMRSGAVD